MSSQPTLCGFVRIEVHELPGTCMNAFAEDRNKEPSACTWRKHFQANCPAPLCVIVHLVYLCWAQACQFRLCCKLPGTHAASCDDCRRTLLR